MNSFNNYIDAKECCKRKKKLVEFPCTILICKFNLDGKCKNKYTKCKGVFLEINKDGTKHIEN